MISEVNCIYFLYFLRDDSASPQEKQGNAGEQTPNAAPSGGGPGDGSRNCRSAIDAWLKQVAGSDAEKTPWESGQDGKPEQVVMSKTVDLRRHGDRYHYEARLYTRHDTGTWALVAGRSIQGSDEYAFEELGELWEGPQAIGKPGESDANFLGRTLVIRLRMAQLGVESERKRIADMWLKWVMRLFGLSGNDEASELEPVQVPLHGEESYLCTLSPLNGSGNRPRVLLQLLEQLGGTNAQEQDQQTMDHQEKHLDSLTYIQVRQIESYVHKIYWQSREYMGDEKIRGELKSARDNLMKALTLKLPTVRAPTRPSSEVLDKFQDVIDGVTDAYVCCSEPVRKAQSARNTLELNVRNLGHRKAAVPAPSRLLDEVYVDPVQQGETTIAQIDGDLRYTEATLRQADIELRRDNARLEILRQRNEETDQRMLDTTVVVLTVVLVYFGFLTILGVPLGGVIVGAVRLSDAAVKAILGALGVVVAVGAYPLTWGLLHWLAERRQGDRRRRIRPHLIWRLPAQLAERLRKRRAVEAHRSPGLEVQQKAGDGKTGERPKIPATSDVIGGEGRYFEIDRLP